MIIGNKYKLISMSINETNKLTNQLTLFKCEHVLRILGRKPLPWNPLNYFYIMWSESLLQKPVAIEWQKHLLEEEHFSAVYFCGL